MRKLWLNNELVDRVAMLQKTETEHPGINQVAIEKDWWVTATLRALFQTDCHESLIFKGGTSLSKGSTSSNAFRKILTWPSATLSLGLKRQTRTNATS